MLILRYDGYYHYTYTTTLLYLFIFPTYYYQFLFSLSFTTTILPPSLCMLLSRFTVFVVCRFWAVLAV